MSFNLLAQFSQAIIPDIAYFVRFEVIRTEINQYRGRLIAVYFYPDRLSEYRSSWKQILFFFFRTQTNRNSMDIGPKYAFSKLQKSIFKGLLRECQRYRNKDDFQEFLPPY